MTSVSINSNSHHKNICGYRSVTMKSSLLQYFKNFAVRLESRKLLQLYVCFELVIWTILSYSAVYYGKIFDYRFTDPSEFASRIDTNFYYEFMFGHLNLTTLDVKEQQNIQGKFLSHFIIKFVIFNDGGVVSF